MPVATSTVDLDAEELRLRASETNVGNLVADAIRESVQADVGLINSGGDSRRPHLPRRVH